MNIGSSLLSDHMTQKVPSIGKYLVDNFFTEYLTPPIVARAVGMHLGEFEGSVLWKNVVPEITLKRLVALSYKTFFFRPDADVLDEGVLLAKIKLYDEAPEEERETITECPWDEPVIVQRHEAPDCTKLEWFKKNPVFTLEAFTSTWHYGKTNTAKEELSGTAWYSFPERIEGVLRNVWRFNPLKLQRPAGRPVERPFNPTPKAENLDDMKARKVKDLLDKCRNGGLTQLSLPEVTKEIVGYVPRSQNVLQQWREMMTENGWVYNPKSKKWQPQ